ncbi:hypothetical protein KCU73_g946, partial [Aureobasidium melanogenum]
MEMSDPQLVRLLAEIQEQPRCVDWGAKLQHVCEALWSALDNGNHAKLVDPFIDILHQDDAFALARLVIPELRMDEPSLDQDNRLKQKILDNTAHQRKKALFSETAQQHDFDNPLYRHEKEVFAEAEMYRASLLLYGSAAFDSVEQEEILEWLANRPKKPEQKQNEEQARVKCYNDDALPLLDIPLSDLNLRSIAHTMPDKRPLSPPRTAESKRYKPGSFTDQSHQIAPPRLPSFPKPQGTSEVADDTFPSISVSTKVPEKRGPLPFGIPHKRGERGLEDLFTAAFRKGGSSRATLEMLSERVKTALHLDGRYGHSPEYVKGFEKLADSFIMKASDVWDAGDKLVRFIERGDRFDEYGIFRTAGPENPVKRERHGEEQVQSQEVGQVSPILPKSSSSNNIIRPSNLKAVSSTKSESTSELRDSSEVESARTMRPSQTHGEQTAKSPTNKSSKGLAYKFCHDGTAKKANRLHDGNDDDQEGKDSLEASDESEEGQAASDDVASHVDTGEDDTSQDDTVSNIPRTIFVSTAAVQSVEVSDDVSTDEEL